MLSRSLSLELGLRQHGTRVRHRVCCEASEAAAAGALVMRSQMPALSAHENVIPVNIPPRLLQ